MDLPLLIRKLKDASQYADRAWKDDRHLPFLDLSLVCEEAAKALESVPLMVSVDLPELKLTPGGYIQYSDASNR